MERLQQIERSLITTYRKKIWSKFVNAVKEYELIQDGDCIAVCISGGKDSMLLAKCFQELKKYGKDNFTLKFLVMDPGYAEENLNLIKNNAKLLDIPIEIFKTEIFNAVTTIENSPCYFCARMRRGHLYNEAKERGCNKIALGHHYDDVIETILMGMLYNGQMQSMMPKLHSKNFEGMQLIRPLYQVRESDIINWKNYNGLEFLRCACRFTENIELGKNESKRAEIKKLIKTLSVNNPGISMSIFKSAYNVQLDNLIEFKKNGVRTNFLAEYDNIKSSDGE